MSHAELADWLTSGGYPTTVSDVKNAGRPGSRLIAGSVPLTATTQEFADFVVERFPFFRSHMMFPHPPTPAEENILIHRVIEFDYPTPAEICGKTENLAVLDRREDFTTFNPAEGYDDWCNSPASCQNGGSNTEPAPPTGALLASAAPPSRSWPSTGSAIVPQVRLEPGT